jgi:hypothetical protein
MATPLSRTKRFLFATTSILLALGVGALIVELAVRTLMPSTDFLWQWDSRIGMKLVPLKEGRAAKPGSFDVRVKINSIGFRDRDHALEKPAGTRRVALLGDSFVEAIQVPFELSITALLEKRIPKTEVLNFAVSGTGTARQYLALREYGLRYNPDLVLLFLFAGNDISDNSDDLQGRPYVPYPLLTADNRLARDANGQPLFTSFRDPEPGRSAIAVAIKDHWKTYRFIREAIDKSPEAGSVLYRLGLADTPPQSVSAFSNENLGPYEIYRRPLKPAWSNAWEVTEELVLATRELANARGARFAVVLVPAAWEVHPHLWEAILHKFPAMRRADLDLDQPSQRLSRFLEAQNVTVFNLLPDFRRAARAPGSLYIPADAHWTSDGHRLAAELIAEPVASLLDASIRATSDIHVSSDRDSKPIETDGVLPLIKR